MSSGQAPSDRGQAPANRANPSEDTTPEEIARLRVLYRPARRAAPTGLASRRSNLGQTGTLPQAPTASPVSRVAQAAAPAPRATPTPVVAPATAPSAAAATVASAQSSGRLSAPTPAAMTATVAVANPLATAPFTGAPPSASTRPISAALRRVMGPTPAGLTDQAWRRHFNAADSQIYRRAGRNSAESRRARESGETRQLALNRLAAGRR